MIVLPDLDTTRECARPAGRRISVKGRGGKADGRSGRVKDWVEGLRSAARKARNACNIMLAEALDITRFEVYESYLDEEYTNNRAKR